MKIGTLVQRRTWHVAKRTDGDEFTVLPGVGITLTESKNGFGVRVFWFGGPYKGRDTHALAELIKVGSNDEETFSEDRSHCLNHRGREGS